MQHSRASRTQESTSLCDTKFKLVFLGDSGVGKSSIIDRFVRDEFDTNSNSTVGIDFLSRNLTVGSRTYRLQLWDTAGQEKYKSLVPAYLKDANAAFFVYDVTRKQSLDNLQSWLQLFRDHQLAEAQAVLVGTKIDLCEINPLREQAQKLAKQQGMRLFEVSALTSLGVSTIFLSTVESLTTAGLRKPEEVEAERVIALLEEVGHSRQCCGV